MSRVRFKAGWEDLLRLALLKGAYEREAAARQAMPLLRRFLSALRNGRLHDPVPGLRAAELGRLYAETYNRARGNDAGGPHAPCVATAFMAADPVTLLPVAVLAYSDGTVSATERTGTGPDGRTSELPGPAPAAVNTAKVPDCDDTRRARARCRRIAQDASAAVRAMAKTNDITHPSKP